MQLGNTAYGCPAGSNETQFSLIKDIPDRERLFPGPARFLSLPILQFPIWRAHDRRREALDASDAADCCPAASAPIARAAGPHEEARADAHTDVGEAAAEATGTEAVAAVLAACLRRLSQPPAIPSPERLFLMKERAPTPTSMWAKLKPKRRAPESSPRSP